MGKLPFSFLSPAQNRGGVGGPRRPWDPTAQATAAAGKRGKRRRGARGSVSLTYPEQKRLMEGGRWRPAEDGRNGYGGGAVGSGRGRAEAGVAVVVEKRRGGPFIGRARR